MTYTTSTGTKYTGRGAGLADLYDLLNEIRAQATAGGAASVFKGKTMPALLAAVDALNRQGWVTQVHGVDDSHGIVFVTLGESSLAGWHAASQPASASRACSAVTPAHVVPTAP